MSLAPYTGPWIVHWAKIEVIYWLYFVFFALILNIFHLIFHLMYYFKCEHTVSSIFTNEQPNIQKDEDLSQVTPIMVKQDLNPVLSGSKAHASLQPEVNIG